MAAKKHSTAKQHQQPPRNRSRPTLAPPENTRTDIVVPWPPPLVVIRKVAPVSDPATPSGDPRTYGYGVLNLGVSLPVDFVIVGWLMNTPVVGEIVRVLRVTRNSTIMPGIFTTTEVTKIPRSGEFHTANSIYLWSEIAEAPEVLVPKATPRKSGGDLQDDLDAVRGDR